MVSSGKQVAFDRYRINSYNFSQNAELCSGSTGDFESLSPGSNPGSAASKLHGIYYLTNKEAAAGVTTVSGDFRPGQAL